MFKLLACVREILVVMVLGGAVTKWFQNANAGKVASMGAFVDALALSPARYKPQALFNAVQSGQFNDLEIDEKMTFLQDATQAFIQPNMSDIEAVHVRSVFVTIAFGLMSDISDMSVKEPV